MMETKAGCGQSG